MRDVECEICGHENGHEKRLRTSDNRLVCGPCYIRFIALKEEFEKWKKDYLKAPCKYTSPFSAVPPLDILKRAKTALNIGGSYQQFAYVLADYYGIETPIYSVNPNKVSNEAIACYHPDTNQVSTKEKIISINTAFHEFYHALQRWNIVPRKGYDEKDTQNYAAACEVLLLGG